MMMAISWTAYLTVNSVFSSEVPLKNDKKVPTTKEFSVTAKKKSKNRKRFEDEVRMFLRVL